MDEPFADPPPATGMPRLRVEGFEGPLDFLVEMVRRDQLDLARLPLTALIDQFATALATAGPRVPLERQGDWLVMASQMVLLRSQLLMPAGPAEAQSAEADAQRRVAQVTGLVHMRAAVAWLSARPQLGRDVFGRGAPETPPLPQSRDQLHVAFLEALLRVLEGGAAADSAHPAVYRIEPLDLWRVPEALAHIGAMLRQQPGLRPLWHFQPAIPPAAPRRRLRLRVALASTFVAGLELVRDDAAVMQQAAPFAPIALGAAVGAAGGRTRPAGG